MIFKLDMSGFQAFKKRFYATMLPIFVLMAAICLFIVWDAKELIPIMFGLLIFVFSFTVYFQIKKQKRIWESFELEITDTSIIRRQDNHGDIEILKSDVKEIFRVPSGYFVIKGPDQFNTILIPARVINSVEFEAIISELGEIKIANAKKGYIKFYFYFILTLLTLVIFLVSKNKYLITASGLLIVGVMVYGAFVLVKSKLFPKKLRYASIFALIIILSFLKRIYELWF